MVLTGPPASRGVCPDWFRFAQHFHRPASVLSHCVTQDAPKGAGGVCQLTIPGFTYPVREFYLEDILEMTGHTVARTSRFARKLTKAQLAAVSSAAVWLLAFFIFLQS